MLVQFILKNVQIVGGGYGDDVVQRMPGCVDNLFAEVQTVHTDFILFALPTCAYFARLEDGSRPTVFPRRFVGHVLLIASVEHPEEVIVRTRHHNTAGSTREEELVSSHIIHYSNLLKQLVTKN